MNPPELDTLSGPDATNWFHAQQRAIRGQIIHSAHEYYRRVREDGPEAAEDERATLFAAIEMLAMAQAEQKSYFAERKLRARTERQLKVERQIEEMRQHRESVALAGQLNRQRNLEEGRRQHEEAVARARAEGKITDAVRKDYNDTRARRRDEQERLIAAAHENADPSPIPLIETREEQIVNDQLRSFGSVIRIDTHNIEYRLRGKREQEGMKR